MTHLFSVHSVDFYNFVAASSLVCFCNSSAVTVGRFSLPLAPHLVRVMFLIVFFLRHQFVGRYSISMHAYRKWRACWPCVCLVFDVVPFSKSTSHAACVERHECNARTWEKSHAWLWAWSGILQSKDANANRVPLLLRNEKTQPRFVYHMGMCAVCHSISFLSSGTCNQKPDIIHCCTWASPFDLFVFPCGIFWVFSSLCFVLMQPSHPAQKDWLWMIACYTKNTAKSKHLTVGMI